MKAKTILLAVGCWLAAGCEAEAPEPYGAVPTEAQVEWQRMEINMFCHFGPNTFSGAEWGDGKEGADVFAPEGLDCGQWVGVAADAGMGGIILTAKHHDGYCLWPSAQSTHTVAYSRWREGKGDVLRELRDAVDGYNTRTGGRMQMGLYLSPWDRNHPAYGTEEYNKVFAATLREVHTAYGPLFEQWFDGACGEGPTGKRQEYDWRLFNSTVLERNPRCVIFSDIGPGCRWVGNEEGRAGSTCWSTLDTAGCAPGTGNPPSATLETGTRHGSAWMAAEVDVSIRPGWFWHGDEEPKSVEELMDIYYQSVGHNALLLLNVPPNRQGRIDAADSLRLMEFRAERERVFAHDLAQEATVKGHHLRGRRYRASQVTDTAYHSYWAAPDTVGEVVMEWADSKEVKLIVLQEYIPLGQRVERWEAEWDGGRCEGTTIGYKRIVRLPEGTSTRRLTLRMHGEAAPLMNRIAVY